jgi:hypothetical protein
MADMTMWYFAILVGAAMVIIGVRSIYKVRKQMHLDEFSIDGNKKGVDVK